MDDKFAKYVADFDARLKATADRLTGKAPPAEAFYDLPVTTSQASTSYFIGACRDDEQALSCLPGGVTFVRGVRRM